MDIKEQPVGVFDSGIGGLTVLKEILKALPYEKTVYLGDTARVPYGIRSPETVLRYSFENTRFLISKNIKLLVIACNTSSAISLDAIREIVNIPVVGVIEPGAKAAVKATKNKMVGVIGTEATIKSNSYTKAVKNLDKEILVSGLACPLFVPLVEEGWTDGTIASLVAEKYLSSFKNSNIDTIVLGCTHYPLLKRVISDVMGPEVILIDSAIETAAEIKHILKTSGLEREKQEKPSREFFVTDSVEKFLNIGEKFLGEKIENIEKIQLGG